MKHAGSIHCSYPCVYHTCFTLLILVTMTSIVLSAITPPRVLYGGWNPILPGHPFYFGSMRRKQQYFEHLKHYENKNSEFIQPVYDRGHHYEPHNLNHVEEHIEEHTEYELVPQKSKSTHSKPSKDIFSYYPPQSAYDKPPEIGVEYKPVYLEFPRKPLDIFENPHQKVPYIVPSFEKEPHSFPYHHSIPHNNEQAYLKITPLSHIDPQSAKHVEVGPNAISYQPNIQNKPQFQIVHTTHDGTLLSNPDQSLFRTILHQPQNEEYVRPNGHNNVGSHKHHFNYDDQSLIIRKNNHQIPIQTHNKGNSFPLNHVNGVPIAYRQAFHGGKVLENQNLKDIHLVSTYPRWKDLKLSNEGRIADPNYHVQQNSGRKNNLYNLFPPKVSYISSGQHYPHRTNFFPNSNYKTLTNLKSGLMSKAKHILTQNGASKNTEAQVKKFIAPNVSYNNPSHQTIYTLPSSNTLLDDSNLNFKHVSQDPTYDLKGQIMPNILYNLHNNAKLEGHYRSPNIVTDIKGTPALIEREVAIVHLPVGQQEYLHGNQGNQEQNELLYITASTPQSSLVHHLQQINESTPTVSFNQNSIPNYVINFSSQAVNSGNGQVSFNPNPLSNTMSETNKYGDGFVFVRTNDIENGGSQNEKTPQIHSQNSEQYYSEQSLVGSTNMQDPKQQVFHAYYAPSDHKPPKGYIRMSSKEFNKLFKHAEIRYVDEEPQSLNSQHKLDQENKSIT